MPFSLAIVNLLEEVTSAKRSVNGKRAAPNTRPTGVYYWPAPMLIINMQLGYFQDSFPVCVCVFAKVWVISCTFLPGMRIFVSFLKERMPAPRFSVSSGTSAHVSPQVIRKRLSAGTVAFHAAI